MIRRALPALAAIVLVVLSVPARPAEAQVQTPAQPRPNVLVIMADDLNDDIGVWGHPIVKTPNLDRLAARGVRFERAYAQFALCNPSRASYMTGLRPETTRVTDLTTHFRQALPNVVTLPQMFRNAGYYAARVGKIYHYGNPGDIGTSGLDDPPSWDRAVNPKGIDIDEQPRLSFAGPSRGLGASLSYYASPAADSAHTDGMVADETIKLLEANANRPFFIAAGFYRPHCPFISPQKYFDLYPDLSRMPVSEFSELLLRNSTTASYAAISWNVPENEQREAIRAYYAAISFMDAQVGKLLDALDRLDLTRNTIVVFMSDHGYHLGDHGGLWMKQTLFERAARTPVMLAGPGVAARGLASHRIVELIDLYPTLADLTGVPPPATLQGRSLRPLLDDPGMEWPHAALSQMRGVLTPPGQGRGGPPGGRGANPASLVEGFSVRTERFRYIEWGEGRVGQELFDELNDPGELRNLANDPFYARTVMELRQQLASMRAGRGN